jgi:putative ATP-binding cassette transporter
MDFIRFLLKESGSDGRKVAYVTIGNGLASGLMVSIVIKAAAATGTSKGVFANLVLFLVTAVIIMLSRRYSLTQITVITETIVDKIRLRIIDKIRRTDLLYFENSETSHFLNLLTTEAQRISSTASQVITATSSAVMLIVSFALILVHSVAAFALTFGFIVIVVFAYRISVKAAEPVIKRSLEIENDYFKLVQEFWSGFKELKIDAQKNKAFFSDHLNPLADSVRDTKIAGANIFVNSALIAFGSFYLLIGTVIFILPKISSTSSSIISQVTATILFIYGPLGEVVGILPQISKASNSIKAIAAMEESLDNELSNKLAVNYNEIPKPYAFDKIEAKDVIFRYPTVDDTPGYSIGPVNLSINKGEIIFIKGGNGSGKSTFLKVITGLYKPSSGALLINGSIVTSANYHRFRNLYSIIFTDFHLFEKIYTTSSIDEDKLNSLMTAMDLANKTSYIEGRFSHLSLSTGQRKRLALIVAILEQKEVLIFDEWAADQDPSFRKHFYEVILPELKSSGRTIIAATHDDRYFHICDRCFSMEYGLISETKIT